jgi:signal transduction histidine kinase
MAYRHWSILLKSKFSLTKTKVVVMNKNKILLLVSDQNNDCELLQSYCESNNYDLKLYNKQTCISNQANQLQAQLILLDEALIKQLTIPPSQPVLLITESIDTIKLSQWLSHGIVDFLLKPLVPTLVLNRIEQQLSHQNTTSQLTRQTLKMRELGELVGLISHEIASPLGNVNTAVSYLVESNTSIQQSLDNKTLGATDLERFLQQMQKALGMCVKNGSNASGIINSFRTVASNQCLERLNQFYLYQYLDDMVLTLKSKLKKLPHEIHIAISESLEMTTYSGVFSQIIMTLISKSIRHSFDNNVAGRVIINAIEETDHNGQKMIVINYHDNGRGMDEATLQAALMKSQTTTDKRNGLSFVMLRQMVEQQLQGTLQLSSTPDKGIQCTLTLPQRLE